MNKRQLYSTYCIEKKTKNIVLDKNKIRLY